MNEKIIVIGDVNKRKTNVFTVLGFLALGYSVYAQACKIESLKKDIEEIKSQKGE